MPKENVLVRGGLIRAGNDYYWILTWDGMIQHTTLRFLLREGAVRCFLISPREKVWVILDFPKFEYVMNRTKHPYIIHPTAVLFLRYSRGGFLKLNTPPVLDLPQLNFP